MSATEQLGVYDQYLERWNYNGSNELGIMQGAHTNRSLSEVVYKDWILLHGNKIQAETNQWWRYNSRRYE